MKNLHVSSRHAFITDLSTSMIDDDSELNRNLEDMNYEYKYKLDLPLQQLGDLLQEHTSYADLPTHLHFTGDTRTLQRSPT